MTKQACCTITVGRRTRRTIMGAPGSGLSALKVLLAALVFALLPAFAASAGNLAQYDFDRGDQLATAGAFTPWADLMRRQAAEQPELDTCVADVTRCPLYWRGYRSIMLAAAQMSRANQLILVNRFIDRRSWRNANSWNPRWQSLGAFLREGGNCKDFAIAKYFMLRALGFGADELRIVVARQIGKMGQHALLAVRDGFSLQLYDTDNLIYSATSHGDYDFLFSINETALWDHKMAPQQIAQAPRMTVGAR